MADHEAVGRGPSMRPGGRRVPGKWGSCGTSPFSGLLLLVSCAVERDQRPGGQEHEHEHHYLVLAHGSPVSVL
jgi:hypothetical protein